MESIREDIKTRQFKNIYLLFGDEVYLRNQYRDMLKTALAVSDMNFSSYSGKDVNVREVIDLAETMPFLSDYRLIMLEDTGWAKTSCEEMADYIAGIPATTIVILTESEVDKRSKVYKAAKQYGRAVEFERQDERTLTAWILGKVKKENKQITQGAVNLLFERCGLDMEVISSELEKLFSYTFGKDGITVEDVKTICTKQTETNIFDMVTAVSKGEQKEALELYYEMLSAREEPMRILYLLLRQFNMMLQVKDMGNRGLSQKAMSDKMKLAPFIVGKITAQARRFSYEELKAVVAEGLELESAVKNGTLNDRMSVELFLMKYSA